MLFLFEYATCTPVSLPAGIAVEGLAMFRAMHASFSELLRVRTTPSHAGWMQRFQELAEECEHALVIAPESGGVLLELTRVLEKAGTLNLGSSPEGVRIAGDKLLCHRALRGLPQPETELYDGTCTLEPPLVAKPRVGEGGERMLVRSEEELERVPRGWLLQELVPGRAMSASLLVGDDVHVLSLNTQRFSGTSYAGGEIISRQVPEEVIEAASRIKGLHGYVGVDFVQGEHTWIIEVNPRLTTPAAGLTRALDTSLGELLLRNAEGRQLPSVQLRQKVGVRKLRGSIKQGMQEIASTGGYTIALEVLP